MKIVPQGNAKTGVPYTLTKPWAKRLLNENLKPLPMSAAVSKTRKDLGGPMKVLSDANIPRGKMQAFDMKRDRSRTTCSQPRCKQLDEMASFNWYAKTEGKGFVRMNELWAKHLFFLQQINSWLTYPGSVQALLIIVTSWWTQHLILASLA